MVTTTSILIMIGIFFMGNIIAGFFETEYKKQLIRILMWIIIAIIDTPNLGGALFYLLGVFIASKTIDYFGNKKSSRQEITTTT